MGGEAASVSRDHTDSREDSSSVAKAASAD